MQPTSHAFKQNARVGLADADLQRSLERFQTGFTVKRADAAARLPEFEALRDQARAIKDLGFLPEGEIHSRSARSTPYEMGHDAEKYPFDRIMAAAEQASSVDANEPSHLNELMQALQDDDSAVRYWGAMGLLMRKQAGVGVARLVRA